MTYTTNNTLIPYRPSPGAISRVALLAAYSRAGYTEVGIVLSHQVEGFLLDWVPFGDPICAVLVAAFVKESHKWAVDRYLISRQLRKICMAANQCQFLSRLPKRVSGVEVLKNITKSLDVDGAIYLSGWCSPSCP
ncbi:hypothetical protein T265_11969 [Opisthorchis viverrini]|uniref:Uncharacterized protein n=1 Tax=Opisthorchis viverrini TaxID=6198 RepID=A0A074Z129_OPIVI|nr:hypothetical protein T265_11969 [Opisthorchis viverrini]KER19157.1 hypothetical protein T265_11969 [Opisthorchis viverrini]